MEVRKSSTFLDSLERLTSDEQKTAKIGAFELQVRPTHPSMQLHRVEKSKDTEDLARIIVLLIITQ